MKAKIISRINSSRKGNLVESIPLRTPYSIHIDPCSLCNFKCNFCFQSDDKAIKARGLKRGLMPVELFEKICRGLANFPDRVKKVKIGLHGEPTMHPKLPEMITYLRSIQFNYVGFYGPQEIELFTNGVLLNPELNEKLLNAGVSTFNISVEGVTGREYKKVTGVEIDFDKLVANIKDLNEKKDRLNSAEGRKRYKIHIKTISPHKKEFFKLFGNICDEIFVEKVVPQWAGIKRDKLGKTGMYGQKVEYKEVCPFPFMYMHFNYDGIASACTLDWARQVTIGDVKKNTVTEIWYGEPLRELQLQMLAGGRRDIPFCDKCLAPMVCCKENLDKDRIKLFWRVNENNYRGIRDDRAESKEVYISSDMPHSC